MSSSHVPSGLPPGRSPPPVRLCLQGQLTLLRGDTALQLPYARAYGLLIMLTLSLTPLSRGVLVQTLWPGVPEPEGRARLRHALFTLDRLLRPTRVERIHQQLQLPRRALRCDLWETAQHCERIETADPHSLKIADAEALAGVWRAPLAGTFAIADAPAFQQWLTEQREFWARRIRQAHQRVTAELALRGHAVDGGKTHARTPATSHSGGGMFAERRWIACIMALAREPDTESTHRTRAVTTLGEALLKNTSAVLQHPHPGSLLAIFGLLPDPVDPCTQARLWANLLAKRYHAAHVPAAIGVHSGWHLSGWPEHPIDPTGAITRRAFETAAGAATAGVVVAPPAGLPPRHDEAGDHVRQIDALEPPMRRAVACLAIYRGSFSRSDALAVCHGLTKDAGRVPLPLAAAGILVSAGRGRWNFAGPMLRYLAGLRLPLPQAVRLHRIVALRCREQDRHVEAAWHFARGAQPGHAAAAWHAAAEQALMAGRVVRAHYCYQRAARAMMQAERLAAGLRSQIPLGLAAAARLLRGQRDDHQGGPAVQLLGQLKHSGTPVPMQVRHMLWTLRLLARGPLAARALGTHLMRNASVAPWRAVAHACRAVESLLRGRYRQCISAANETEKWARLAIGRDAAPTPGVDMVSIARAAQAWAQDMSDTAYPTAAGIAPLYPPPEHTAGMVWYCRAMCAQYRGEAAEARRCAAQLLAHAERTGLQGFAVIARVVVHTLSGPLRPGATAASQLADALEAVRQASTLALSQVPLIAGLAGEVCLHLGALAPLQSCVQRGLRAARRTHVRLGLTRLLWLQARICELRGEPGRAAQWQERARHATRFLREAPYHRAVMPHHHRMTTGKGPESSSE